MFDDRDLYPSMFEDAAVVTSNVQNGDDQFKAMNSAHIMPGQMDGLLPEFSSWPMAHDSYAMESTPSNCSTTSSCFSTGFAADQSSPSKDGLAVSPPLSATTSTTTNSDGLSWPLSTSTSMDFNDPYATSLTPPSDTDIYKNLATTLSPESTFYCEPSNTSSMPTSASTPQFADFRFPATNTEPFPSSPPVDMSLDSSQGCSPTAFSPIHNVVGSHAQQQQQQQQQQMPPSPPKPAIPPTTYTKWVKLTKMSDERVEKIKQLAVEKGIELETVESVLTLYSQNPKVDNEVNRFVGDDVYIKITMGGSALANDDNDTKTMRRKSDGSLITKKKHRKQRPNYIKRPLNSFMLYRKSQTQSAMAYAISSKLKLNHQNISQIIGLMWQTESKELKDEFAKFAGQEKELHKAMHPDYKFCPQKKHKKSQSTSS